MKQKSLCLLAMLFASIVCAQESKVEKKTVKAHDGLPIYCEVRGEGDTALVFIHGWGGDHEYWKNQVEAFAPNYRVVAIDQAGHSQSGKERKEWKVAELAQDVESVVKELGLKRVILVGHSMGGPVALLAAKRLPGTVIAVIGSDTLQNAEYKMPEDTVKGFLQMFETNFRGTVSGMFGSMLNSKADPELKKWLGDKAANQNQKMAIGLMKDMTSQDTVMLFKEAKVPIRCINSSGGYQFFRPTDVEVNKKYGDFNVVTIAEVGHYPMLEKPEEFNQKLREILKEVEKR
ncbi:MAG TPA: alpha/beta hydrolase [Gemmatales bacterium]|nr:alpha/beta hydrolase [Gemmatales bacterium]